MLKMRKRDVRTHKKAKKDHERRNENRIMAGVSTLGSTVCLFLPLSFGEVETKRIWWIQWSNTNVFTTIWDLAFHHLLLHSSVNLLTQSTLSAMITWSDGKRKDSWRNHKRRCWVNSCLTVESQWWDELSRIYEKTRRELLGKKLPFGTVSGAVGKFLVWSSGFSEK